MWPTVALEEIGQWGSGGTPLVSKREYYDGDVPWLITEDLNDGVVRTSKRFITQLGLRNSSAKIVEPGTLLIAMYGSIGKLGIAGMTCATNQAIAFCRCNGDKINAKFLFYYLLASRAALAHAGRGGTQQNISQEILKAFPVPLPPLHEQKCIATLLDKADRLRRSRRYVQDLSATFLQSIFLEMFGNPVTNPMRWDVVLLEDLGNLDRGRSKHRPRNAPHLLGGPYPLIQTSEVANSGGYIRTYEQTYSKIGLEQSKMWPKGTLCITIAANIAKTGILLFDACFPDSVVGFTANAKTNAEYVQQWFSFVQQYLERIAPESAQKNINLEILRGLHVPLPPIELQQKFAGIVRRVERVRAQQREAERQAEHLFQTLLHRAFADTV